MGFWLKLFPKELSERLQYAKQFAHTLPGISAKILADSRKKLKNLPKTNFDLALGHLYQNNLNDAAMRFWILTRIAQDNPNYYYNWARCLVLMGQKERAMEKLDKALSLDKKHVLAKFLQQGITSPAKIKEFPSTYLAEPFDFQRNNPSFFNNDRYIDNADIKTSELKQTILEAIIDQLETNQPRFDLLDLECGSGFCGEYFAEKNMLRQAVGVEPSQILSDIASSLTYPSEKNNKKKIYSIIHTQSAHQFLGSDKDKYSLIIAPLLLSTTGPIDAILKNVKNRLKKGGIIAFYTEETPRADYVLHITKTRFAHSTKYIQKECQTLKLQCLEVRPYSDNYHPNGNIFIYSLK